MADIECRDDFPSYLVKMAERYGRFQTRDAVRSYVASLPEDVISALGSLSRMLSADTCWQRVWQSIHRARGRGIAGQVFRLLLLLRKLKAQGTEGVEFEEDGRVLAPDWSTLPHQWRHLVNVISALCPSWHTLQEDPLLRDLSGNDLRLLAVFAGKYNENDARQSLTYWLTTRDLAAHDEAAMIYHVIGLLDARDMTEEE